MKSLSETMEKINAVELVRQIRDKSRKRQWRICEKQ